MATARHPEAEFFVLVGAKIRDAEEFCRERKLPRTEIGRTVFPTSMSPDHLRGLRGMVTFVYTDDYGRAWSDVEHRTNMEAMRIHRYHEQGAMMNELYA